MKLTNAEIKHFKQVLWGTQFWRWARWPFLAILVYEAISSYMAWASAVRVEWVVLGFVYLLVAWPGLCRAYVFHTLHRVLAADPEARAQLAAAGVREFQSGGGEHA